MKKLRNFWFVCVSLVLAITCAYGVPALSFEETITGEVSGYAVFKAKLLGMKPENMVLYKVVLSIGSERPKRIPPHRRYVEVLSKRSVPMWYFGRRIKAVIIYVGDERGGYYWLRRIEEVE